MTSPPVGLRERKKQRRRATIAAVALELFDRQGYAATTIPQIAEAADVAPRTVSSYFPAKEDLVFPDAQEEHATLERRLRERPEGQRAAEALRGWILDQLPHWRAQEPQVLARRRVIASEPALQAVEQELLATMERTFAAAIATDLGLPADALEPRMAAAATLAVFDVLGDEQIAADPDDAEPVDWDATLVRLDRALAFVEAGIARLAER